MNAIQLLEVTLQEALRSHATPNHLPLAAGHLPLRRGLLLHRFATNKWIDAARNECRPVGIVACVLPASPLQCKPKYIYVVASRVPLPVKPPERDPAYNLHNRHADAGGGNERRVVPDRILAAV